MFQDRKNAFASDARISQNDGYNFPDRYFDSGDALGGVKKIRLDAYRR